MTECLGMVEVRGYLGAVAVADSAVKAANVRLLSSQKIKGGITTILLNGDVGAVEGAVESAILVAKEIGSYRSHHVIPRPDKQTDLCFIPKQVVFEKKESSQPKDEEATSQLKEVDQELAEFEAMKVVDLRKLALTKEGFPLNSKEIKFANKAELIKAFSKLESQGGES